VTQNFMGERCDTAWQEGDRRILFERKQLDEHLKHFGVVGG
jgi:hypothetical protein